MKSNTTNSELKKGTLKCPKCRGWLHFEVMGSMRIIRDGVYNAYCPTDKKYFTVKS